MVLICTRAAWGLVARPERSSLERIAMVLSPGGPRLRPCLAGKICFQLSCSEALCDYYMYWTPDL